MGLDLGGELVLVLGNLLQFLVVADHPFVYIILVSLDDIADFKSVVMKLLAQVHVVFISLEAYVEELLLFRRLVRLLFFNLFKSFIYLITHVLELRIENVDIFFHFFAIPLIFGGDCFHK